MNGLAGPFLWLAGITTRAISSVMSVCHKFGTLASKVSRLQLPLNALTKNKSTLMYKRLGHLIFKCLYLRIPTYYCVLKRKNKEKRKEKGKKK